MNTVVMILNWLAIMAWVATLVFIFNLDYFGPVIERWIHDR
jgi:hypothetical protein